MTQNIKPIETKYNGYRFRSRLEARWAVFFDQIGAQYEYESEGFSIDGTYYLPDFKVFSRDGKERWIEIKPLPEYSFFSKEVVAYFAGPIAKPRDSMSLSTTKDDWRDPIISWYDRKSPWDKVMSALNRGKVASTNHPFVFYAGPYLEGTGHESFCGVGDDRAFNRCINQIKMLREKEWESFIDKKIPVRRELWCWIPKHYCYGTIAEIGYANAVGIETKIAYPTGFDNKEYWFVEKMANEILFADSAWEAMQNFQEPPVFKNNEAFDKIQALHGALIYGDPYRGIMVDYDKDIVDALGGTCHFGTLFNSDLIGAAKIARSWRF